MQHNYTNMGLSCVMGLRLRREVERQLVSDLRKYKELTGLVKFDWSDSCIEGKSATYLDGSLDRYSGIKIFDSNDKYIGEGWMEFIYEKDEDIFIVYWEYLDILQDGVAVGVKTKRGIPNHVFEMIPQRYKDKHSNERIV